MKQYYYLQSDNTQAGPIPGFDLPKYGATLSTLVWTDGMENWQEARNVPELVLVFDQHEKSLQTPTPPIPHHEVTPPPFPEEADLPPCPPNYLWFSIFCVIFGGFLFGLIAFYYSLRVNSDCNNGDYEAAVKHSQRARMWCWISITVAIISSFIFFYLMNKG